MRPGPTQAQVHAELHYDPITGVFTRRNPYHLSRAGKPAGSIDSHGHRQIRVNRRLELAARLAWVYMTGVWPEVTVDHEDRCRSNDRWDNLRLATNAQNCQNQGMRKTNRSGVRGVHWCERRRKWVAQISVSMRKLALGAFDDIADATRVRQAAEFRYHFQPSGAQNG